MHNKRWSFAMASNIKIRLLLGLVAIFVFVYMLNGLPCLGNANQGGGRSNSIRTSRDNQKLLSSTHQISVEQSLVVPKLKASEFEKINIWGIFPSSMFEQVESIGRRHLSDNAKDNQSGQYIVRDGDTLWRIAAEQLGDACRYKEISKLNTDVLKNDNDLTIGMRLSLPAI